MLKILAFFGSDLARATRAQSLQKASRGGYTLLALDSDAIAAAADAGLDYTVTDDWLDPETILHAIQDAAECDTGWYEGAREEFTAAGICWPELDLMAMHWFWRNAMMAQRFAEAFRRSRVRELSFFGNFFSRPATNWERSDIWNALWKEAFPGQTTEMRSFKSWETSLGDQFLSKAIARLRSLFGKAGPPMIDSEGAVRNGSLILLLAEMDVHRTIPTIEQLAKQFPDCVAAVAGGPYREVAQTMSAGLGIPVMAGAPAPMSPRVPLAPLWVNASINAELEAKFWRGYKSVLEKSQGKPWQEILRTLKFHFKYYFKHRWPFLHNKTFPFWQKLWVRIKPAAILVSNINGYYQSACVAARELDIPTVLIPHGGIQSFPRSLGKLFLTDYVFYEGAYQRITFENAGAPASALKGCRFILGQSEYPTRRLPLSQKTDRLRMVALLNPINDGPNLVPGISPRAQMEALRALSSQPDDLSDKLELFLKVHPRLHDLGIIAAANQDLVSKVLPMDSELTSLIESVDLFVAVNYAGSAIMPVLQAGKPLIHLVTEYAPLLERPDLRSLRFMADALIVRDANEFWSLIRALISSPDALHEISNHSETLSQKYFDTSGCPQIGDLLEQVVSRR